MKLATILLCLLLIGCSSASPKKVTRIDACSMAERFVRDGMKAPASAKFQPCRDRVVTEAPTNPPSTDGSGAFWNVSGYVDSQNGFGALLRSNFRITMTYQGGGQWQKQSMSIDAR